MIPDTIGRVHLLLTIEPDNRTFHALSYNDSLKFVYDATAKTIRDVNTQSSWGPDGSCIDGPLERRAAAARTGLSGILALLANFPPGDGRR
ncbi:hypothetical protein ACQ86N_15170 [Puia sp. P3]|uniref:hypothetical protein n=1 Tax=Puia sp. P3 TaxID=3423952 RepID=UPI003D66774F